MRLNERKAAVVLSYMQTLIGVVSMLLYTPVMLRLMGQSEYGIYNLAASTVTYLNLFKGGFASAYTRYYLKYKNAKDEESVKRINGAFLLIFLALMTITFLVGSVVVLKAHLFFGQKLTAEELYKTKVVMGIMVFNMGIIFPTNIFSSYMRANEKYIFARGLQLIKTIANPFIMLPVLLLGGRSVGMAIVTASISIIAEYTFVAYSLFRLKMKFSFAGINFKEFKDIGRFAFFIFLNAIANQLNGNVDKVLLGIYYGTKTVAIYGVAAHLRSYFHTFSSVIYTVFVPRIHKLVNMGNKDRELTEMFTRVGRIQFYILAVIAIGFIFFGKEFMVIWGGKAYEEAYLVTVILLLIAIVPMVQDMAEEIQRAKNLHHYRSVIYTSIVLLNVLISIPLCKRYGILGCTVGTAIADLGGRGIAMNIVYQKKMNLDMIYFWKEILKAMRGMALPALVGFVMMKFAPLDNIYIFLMCGIIFVAVYGVSVWKLSFNKYEKSLVSGVLKKVLKLKDGGTE